MCCVANSVWVHDGIGVVGREELMLKIVAGPVDPGRARIVGNTRLTRLLRWVSYISTLFGRAADISTVAVTSAFLMVFALVTAHQVARALLF